MVVNASNEADGNNGHLDGNTHETKGNATSSRLGKRPAPVEPCEEDETDNKTARPALEATSPVTIGGDDGDEDGDEGNDSDNRDGADDDGTPSPPPPPAKRRTLCGSCCTAAAKYKCPRCPLAYCSIACARTHKESHATGDDASAATADQASNQSKTYSEKKPTPPPPPPPHPFGVLDDAPELKHLFARYPQLPRQLRAIYDATQPPSTAPKQDTEGPGHRDGWRGGLGGRSGRGGRGRGGGRGGYGRGGRGGGGFGPATTSTGGASDATWSKEQGLRQGQAALRRARVDPTEHGDGVRAYCEVVLYLLDGRRGRQEPPGGDDGHREDASMLVRQEVTQADAQMVQRLLQTEMAAGDRR